MSGASPLSPNCTAPLTAYPARMHVSDDTWAGLDLTDEQRLDLLLLAGWYHAISFAARATRIPLEAGAPRFADV